MDLKGFVYYKWSWMAKLLMDNTPFKSKFPNSGLVSGRMWFDNVSASGYDDDKTDEDISGIDYTRYRTLELLALEIHRKNIVGSVAELGVFRGAFSAIMNRLFYNSKHYLFDTFEGFSEIDIQYELKNKYTTDEALTRFKNTSIDLVLSKMKYPENCIIKKGYFPDSLNGLEDKFSFVSLDCDLYKPILEGLEYFYPRLINGGYIMIHDYNSAGINWKGCKEAVYEYEKEHGQIPMIPISDNSGTLILTK